MKKLWVIHLPASPPAMNGSKLVIARPNKGRGYRWTKVEEWTGALSILVDSQNIY